MREKESKVTDRREPEEMTVEVQEMAAEEVAEEAEEEEVAIEEMTVRETPEVEIEETVRIEETPDQETTEGTTAEYVSSPFPGGGVAQTMKPRPHGEHNRRGKKTTAYTPDDPKGVGGF